ncbi:MAG: family 1 encapsulin nanocompartment shell protein [Dehalococcoidia bacterium]|jgi:uncharacterized linocin/CFP29 family protein
MTNKYLAREEAPVEPDTWKMLDAAMVEVARGALAGRRLLDVEGPYGFGLKAMPLEDLELQQDLFASAALPVPSIQVGFALGKRDLAAYERDGLPPNLKPLVEATTRAAELEDTVILKGAARLGGLLSVKGSNTQALSPWSELGTAAGDIINAVTALDGAGYHGPYALALAPARYNLLHRRHPAGNFSELEHLQTIATEGVFKAPVLEKGGVIVNAGRQYASIILGQDMAISFIGPTKENLEFSIVESLALFVRQPGAICALTE